jgi:hypothetical protein
MIGCQVLKGCEDKDISMRLQGKIYHNTLKVTTLAVPGRPKLT